MKHYDLTLEDILSGEIMCKLCDDYKYDFPILTFEIYVERSYYSELLRSAINSTGFQNKQITSTGVMLHEVHCIEAEFMNNEGVNAYGVLTKRVCSSIITFCDQDVIVEKNNRTHHQIKFTANIDFDCKDNK